MEEKRKDTGASPAATSDAPSPANELPSSRRRGGGQKRKAANLSGGGNTSTPPNSSSSKRQAREKPSTVLFSPIHNGPCTRARQQPNNASASDSNFWDTVVKSEGQVSAVAPSGGGGGMAVKSDEKIEDWEALESKIEAEYEIIKSRDVNVHAAPIHSGWFSWTKVHPLEERALPSFFNGKLENRTPEIYLEIRNAIMNRFHANPNTQIELKDLSELSVGELDARQEVMEFLDYWGLINYHPFPETNTAALIVDADKVAKRDSLLQKLYHFDMEQPCTSVAPRTNVAAPTVSSRLLPESLVAEELTRLEGPSVEYHCNSCSADCSRKRYHCQKQADFDLCTECFNSRKFDSDMSPSDFIVMEPAEAAGASGGKWTDQETLLLLEALELFSENWNEIAEHVATKTKAQCILHFVQMPIEDTFLECDDEIDANLKENGDPVVTNNDTSASNDAPEATESKDEANHDPPLSSPVEIIKAEESAKPEPGLEIGENVAVKALREAFQAVGSLPSPEERISFADAGNPVMALAAFLGRLVEPNVVTAATRSSLKSISSNCSGVQLAARHCFILEDPADYKKKSSDTERDGAEIIEQEAKEVVENNGKEKEKSTLVINNDASVNDQDNEDGKDLVTEKMELLVSSDKSHDLVTEEKSRSDSLEKDEDLATQEKDLLVSAEKDKVPAAGENGKLASPNGECTEKSLGATELDSMVTDEKVERETSHPKESQNPGLQKEQAPSIVQDMNEQTSKFELPSSPGKESGDKEASIAVASQSTESPKDVEMLSDTHPSEKTEPPQSITPTSLVSDGTGEDNAKDYKNENKEPLETKNDLDMHNMKRAALTAISAAAVKAKLLAGQEEDQIRQLATSLIEKQLHKLETKLAFFTEMDTVVARVREQLERSKQKLYHERAQIIAARLGMSASSSRPMQQPLPNRVAMTFPNAIPRPPIGMSSLRPPISRSMMAPAPPISNPVVPATVAGNPVQPSNQDNLFSVGMK